MPEDKVERKVAVILATDVVGYSTKIEQNETQTLQTLKACREMIQELIGEHQGPGLQHCRGLGTGRVFKCCRSRSMRL